jgi:hypothetical protein
MNEEEFIDAKWLSVPQALSLQLSGDLPLLWPQLVVIWLLRYSNLATSITSLKEYTEKRDK